MNDDRLAQVFTHVLRGLPLRRAPETLESRVLAELIRRAALPWWRQGYALWPTVVRAAFIAICSGLIGLTFLGGAWSPASSRAVYLASAAAMSWTRPAAALITWAADLAALIRLSVPAAWLYGGMAAAALLYVALFGLGAVAYRALYLRSAIQPSR